ncbi:sialidase family protein [Wenyingzhuangia sp. IMCC45467]
MNFKYLLLASILVTTMFSCKTLKNNSPQLSNITQTYIAAPPVTHNSHSATLEEINTKQLMAAWFGGSYEGAKDVGIYTATYQNKKWSQPKNIITPLVKNNDTLPCWNPVLFKSKSNTLYLFYKVGKNPREWFGAMVSSIDDGKTWSKTTYLPDGFLGPIKNKPIEVTPGVILCGSSTESTTNDDWRVHVETYTEATKTWKKIAVKNPHQFDVIQPTFLVHKPTKIQMLCRSKHDKVIESWSYDYGQTWSKMDSINVVNSNSGIDGIALRKNFFLLVNNPLPRGADWFNGRNVLDVEYSKNGLNWNKLLDLEHQTEGEFSYPAIIQTSDKKIHILYTYNRKYIKHVSFDILY